MKETIGAKGGTNDRRRYLKITTKQKKKLQDYKKTQKLKVLEKEVKKEQLITFLAASPLIIPMTVVEELIKQEKKAEKIPNIGPKKIVEENKTKEEKKDQPTSSKNIHKPISKKQEIKEQMSTPKQEEVKEILTPKQEEAKETPQIPKKKPLPVEVVTQHEIPIPKELEVEASTATDTLQNLKNKKIISEYENKLKDVRIELKKLIFEYNILVETSDELYESKEAEKLLEKLNLIIKKIEKLKSKISIEANNLEEETYLSHLVEEYIAQFQDKKFISDIKDSDLYIMISEKLEELDFEKDKLNSKVDERKEKLKVDEDKFIEIKERYYDFDNFNNKLLKFQSEQDFILKDIEDKVRNSVTVTEKIEYKTKAMTAQSKKLLKMLSVPMMMPGARSAKALVTTTIAYLYFMRKLMRPKLEKKRYKVVEVKDYSKDIESNLDKINDTKVLLTKTSSKLEDIMKEFEQEYKEYFNIIPDCQKLLDNLKIILDSIHQKEEELKKVEKDQKDVLENNNHKVKTLTSIQEI